MAGVRVAGLSYFNPHSPCGERPDVDNPTGDNNQDFNPHSPCGERHRRYESVEILNYFNPHSPCGERPTMVGVPSSRSRFQSTLPLRGATHGGMGFTTNGKISIHTPLAGSDVIAEDVTCVLGDISIHTPLAGSDRRLLPGWNFQYISIHTPLAGSDVTNILVDSPTVGISIHTPLAGSDHRSAPRQDAPCNFNPHSPCGERPARVVSSDVSSYFNPHSPCGERRRHAHFLAENVEYFNPHSPCGERPYANPQQMVLLIISIHTPLAGSDHHLQAGIHFARDISIHTPLAGSDKSWIQ